MLAYPKYLFQKPELMTSKSEDIGNNSINLLSMFRCVIDITVSDLNACEHLRPVADSSITTEKRNFTNI